MTESSQERARPDAEHRDGRQSWVDPRRPSNHPRGQLP